MQFRSTFKTVGILLMTFSLSMLTPLLVAHWYAEGTSMAFWHAFYITFLSGFIPWLLLIRHKEELKITDSFLVTVLFYFALGTFGSLPFLASAGSDLSIVDALFESFSGFTTTGATVITGIDHLPRSILFYRHQLQWLGGMGIIVLAVAILPMLGVGGMQLYRAETPGPIKDTKLTPRIKQTAIALWSIYVGLTVACCVSYWAAGMDFFDALCHSFSTVAIGGFSTHDQSIGYFNSPVIEFVAIFFMIIAGINFTLHFFAFRQKTLLHYLQDAEVKFYLLLLSVAAIFTSYILFSSQTFSFSDSIRYGVFEVVSTLTTTGYATTDFSVWPNELPILIFSGAICGACAGSTGGGIKVIRFLLVYKQAIREIYRLIHPSAVFPIKLNQRPVSSSVIDAVWGFFSIYVFVYLISFLILLATGMDFLTAFSSVGACLNNLGPGLGNFVLHYSSANDFAKLFLCFIMVLGRLEIFTLLVLLTPMFWQR